MKLVYIMFLCGTILNRIYCSQAPFLKQYSSYSDGNREAHNHNINNDNVTEVNVYTTDDSNMNESVTPTVLSSSNEFQSRLNKSYNFSPWKVSQGIGKDKCPHNCKCKRDKYCIWKSIKITDCSMGSWQSVPKDMPQRVKELFMQGNRITKLHGKMFKKIGQVQVLDFSYNLIADIKPRAFVRLKYLRKLDLSQNKIKDIKPWTFLKLKNIRNLNLSGNLIHGLSSDSLAGVDKLENLDLKNNKFDIYMLDMLAFVAEVKHLEADRYVLCCSLKVKTCVVPKESVSSCSNLIQHKLLRVAIWFFAVVISIGNLLAIIMRFYWGNIFSPSSFLGLNLSVADWLMSAYLFTIASANTNFGQQYEKYDFEWRKSVGCQIAGMAFTISSEMCVILLVAITLERLVVVGDFYRIGKYRKHLVYATCFIGWFICLIVAVIPVVPGLPYFDGFPGFYSRSGMCLPLHLTEERVPGWQYSIGVFMAFNAMALMIVIVGYTMIFYIGRKAIRKANGGDKKHNGEMMLANRLSCIVLTDATCWTPVIILSCLALADVRISLNVYYWTAIIVMPLNAAVNPILYTFMNGARLKQKKDKLQYDIESEVSDMTKSHRCASIPDIFDEAVTNENQEVDYTTIANIGKKKPLSRELEEGCIISVQDIHRLMKEIHTQAEYLHSTAEKVPKITMDIILVDRTPSDEKSTENSKKECDGKEIEQDKQKKQNKEIDGDKEIENKKEDEDENKEKEVPKDKGNEKDEDKEDSRERDKEEDDKHYSILLPDGRISQMPDGQIDRDKINHQAMHQSVLQIAGVMNILMMKFGYKKIFQKSNSDPKTLEKF